jgi:hypothetical protein
MHIKYRFMPAACLLAMACSSGAEEPQPPAAAATTGAEQLPPAPPPAPAAAPAPLPAPAAPAAPEPATPQANAAPVETPAMPQLAAVVIHEVKDFDAWKTVFDEHQQARKEAGMLGEGLMRGADNDKLVAIYAPASDAAKLQAFFESKDLKDKMKAGGVKGKPTIYIFNNAGGKMAPPDKTGLFGAITSAKVKDFATFKTAIEGEADARAAAGVVGYGLGQGVDKPTEAFLYLQAEDLAKLKAYVGSKETKKAWKDATVEGQPKTTYVKEGALTMYPK